MRLTMVMIAKNEAENVFVCFASFWDYVDEVVLCDTGSTDDTVKEARRFARSKGEPDKLVILRHKWRDDFARARNAAHRRAAGSLHTYLDLDERLEGGEELRAEAQRLVDDPGLDVVCAEWSGPINPAQWQPRLFRAPVRWEERTWETPLEHGRCTCRTVSGSITPGRYHAAGGTLTSPRHGPRRNQQTGVRGVLSRARRSICEEWAIALDACHRGLELSHTPAEIRAFLAWRGAQAYAELDERPRSDAMARAAVAALDGQSFDWSGSLCRAHLLLADSALERAPEVALSHARRALRNAPTGHLRSESEAAARLAQMRLMDETVSRMVSSLSPSNVISMATDMLGARR